MPSFHSIVAPPKVTARRPQAVKSPSTDREMVKQHSVQAEGHMAMSKGHIAGQRKLAAGLVRDGHDASQALP
jgi:hypothetical protein